MRSKTQFLNETLQPFDIQIDDPQIDRNILVGEIRQELMRNGLRLSLLTGRLFTKSQ